MCRIGSSTGMTVIARLALQQGRLLGILHRCKYI
jgi:hypothetical protein